MKHDQKTHNTVDKKSRKVCIITVLGGGEMKNKVHALGTKETGKWKECGRKW
jgi:hypothetical protein